MTSDIGSVNVTERDHEARAGTADGLCRRNDRLRLSEHLAHALSPCLVPDGAVLELAVFADDDALAVGFDMRCSPKLRDQARREFAPKLAQGSLKRHQVRLVASRERIADHGNDRSDEQGLPQPGAALMPDRLNTERGLPNVITGCHPRSYASSTTGLRSTPMFSISTSTTSPGLRKIGGLRVKPTPAGVPVAITSPGTRSKMVEQYSIRRGIEKISIEVVEVCITVPLTRVSSFRLVGSPISSGVTSHGPKGPVPTKF